MQKEKIKLIYFDKISQLNKYNKAYYDEDSPVVTDQEYDKAKTEILNLEKKYKFLSSKESPSQKVGFKPSGKFRKVKHQIPMLSLANAFSKKDILDFLK